MANRRIKKKLENQRLNKALAQLDPVKVSRDFHTLSRLANQLATVVK